MIGRWVAVAGLLMVVSATSAHAQQPPLDGPQRVFQDS